MDLSLSNMDQLSILTDDPSKSLLSHFGKFFHDAHASALCLEPFPYACRFVRNLSVSQVRYIEAAWSEIIISKNNVDVFRFT